MKQVMSMLKAIAGNDQVKVAIMNSGGALILIQAVSRHIKHAGVSKVFVWFFFSICFDRLWDARTSSDLLIETLSCQPPVLFRTNNTQKRFTLGAAANLTLLYSHH